MNTATVFLPITKVDEAKRLVYGRIAHEVVDHSDEVFDYTTSKGNFVSWSNLMNKESGGKSFGNVRGMHSNIAAGKFVQPLQFNDAEKAIDAVVKVVDDNEWEKVLEGVYTGFSMGGTYERKWPDVVGGKSVTRYTANPNEVSLVDRPCIPTAKYFDIQKKDGSVLQKMFKSAEIAMLAGAVHQAHKEFSQPTSATSGINAYDQEGAKKPKPVEKADEPTEDDVQKAIVTILEKRGARNSASDLSMLQSVHDTVCKLGAACSSMQKEDGQAGNANSGDSDMAKEDGVAKDAINSEGAKRGATVTNGTSGAGPQSSNGQHADPPEGGHGADRGDNNKAKKKPAFLEDNDDDDDDAKEAKKLLKAHRAKQAADAQASSEERIAKSVTATVLAALTEAGVLTKKEDIDVVIEKAAPPKDNDSKAPALFAIGKDGKAVKAEGTGKSNDLSKVASRALPGEKETETVNAATLIKAAYGKPMTHDQLFGR